MKKIIIAVISFCAIFVISEKYTNAEKIKPIIPIAIFPFEERSSGLTGYGKTVSDIVFATLITDPHLYLVERTQMEKIINENELNLSGIVNDSNAIQIGQLTGAKIFITGSVIEANSTLYLVAKIIGSETSRVFGDSVKGKTGDEITALAESLAKKIRKNIHTNSNSLVAEISDKENRISKIKKKLSKAKRPTVIIDIPERHIGQITIDPAAETEITMLCRETGFNVIDSKSGNNTKADIILQGEGFSEFAMRRKNIVSVKARLEIKAVDRSTGQVIATDRCTNVAIDLSEQVAGKKALQEAAGIIAERLLPKLVVNR